MNHSILITFIVSLAFVIISVVKLKLHPFLSLIIGAIIMGFGCQMDMSAVMGEICSGFGGTMGDIGILILLGVCLGALLENSGATKNIARMFLRILGKKKTPLAINLTGYLICIPVFSDAAFIILIDLVKELSKDGKIALKYLVCAFTLGLTMTHAMVIPTPGPLAVAGTVGANIGWFIFYSLIVSLPASYIGGVLYGRTMARGPVWGDTPDKLSTIAELEETKAKAEELSKDDPNTASGPMGAFLILLPIILIIAGTIANMMCPETSSAYTVVAFLSDTNFILLVTVFVAYFMLRKYLTKSFSDIISGAAESVGSILAIIGAGGAFGAIIGLSGLSDYLVNGLQSAGIPIVALAFILSLVLHMGLGSITVALVTTSAVLAPVIPQVGASPVLVGLAICAGAIGLCMPNDSLFWTAGRFCKFSFMDTVRVVTVSQTIAAFVSLAMILLLSAFSGILPGLY